MLGQLPKAGTGCFDLVLDMDKCKKATETPQATGMHAMGEGFTPGGPM